jgi:serine phosphatase RsbU (regulator of sigma subunit)
MVLPDALASVPGCDIAAHYRPARQEEEVGGDFYDVFPVDAARGCYGLLIGDVVGKGKEAAEHTALLRYTARAFCALGDGPAAALSRLNALLESQASELGSASLFLGLYHADTGTMCYANAGHEPPLLARADGAVEVLGTTGTLLGVVADASYGKATVVLLPGDALLLVTDGVTEARDPDGVFLEDTGSRRLLRASLSAATASAVVKDFAQRLETFMAGRRRDDIAILLLRRLAPVSSPALHGHQVAVTTG